MALLRSLLFLLISSLAVLGFFPETSQANGRCTFAGANPIGFQGTVTDTRTAYSVPGYAYGDKLPPQVAGTGWPTSARPFAIADCRTKTRPGQQGPSNFYKILFLNPIENYQPNGQEKEMWIHEDYVEVNFNRKINIDKQCRVSAQSQAARPTELIRELSPLVNQVLGDDAIYENCSTENGYLEAGLARSPLKQLSQVSEVDPRCIYFALKASSDKSFYKCTSQNSDAKITKEPPCLSKELHYQTTKALQEVSNCLGLDDKALFSLLVTESWMMPNARSATGAAGAGQLTHSFIKAGNDNWDTYVEGFLNDRPECQNILPLLKASGKMSTTNACSQTAPPANPLLNIFYSGMNFHDMAVNTLLPELISWRTSSTPLTQDPNDSNQAWRTKLSSWQARRADIDYRSRRIPAAQEKQLRASQANERIQLRREELGGLTELFQNLNTNDQNILSEITMYGHNHSPPLMAQYFETYKRQYSYSAGGDFTKFSGPKGQWIQFIHPIIDHLTRATNPTKMTALQSTYATRVRAQLAKRGSRVSDEAINFIFDVSDHHDGHKSNTAQRLDIIDTQAVDISAGEKCGLY